MSIMLLLPLVSSALEVGNFIKIAKGVLKSENTNVVVFKVTDDNPRLLEALEKHFEKVGINPNDPSLPCDYCIPSLGVHIFKISNDNPQLIVEVEKIIEKFK